MSNKNNNSNMTITSMALDPEIEAFRALKSTICSICRKQNISTANDVRLQQLVNRYKGRYPSLTPELIEEELHASSSSGRNYINSNNDYYSSNNSNNNSDNNDSSPIESLYIDEEDRQAMSDATSPLSRSTDWILDKDETKANYDDDEEEEEELTFYGNRNGIEISSSRSPTSTNNNKGDGSERDASSSTGSNKSRTNNNNKNSNWCTPILTATSKNNYYNPLTYTVLQTFFLLLMFTSSILTTYFNYNTSPYRDWALAGGVTSTTAHFRVRGPSSDDGKRRQFVVSTSSNLAIEKHQILNSPVSHGDFEPQVDHFVRSIYMEDLQPLTPYYYGIVRPMSIPNSARVAGVVGTFTTPAPEGTRMEFRIALGSCALTGSTSDVFTNILETHPLLFLHMGDFHYEDLNTLSVDRRLEAYDVVMGSDSQRLLYMRSIFAYIWDDHDWLGNNRDSESEEEARVAKQSYSLGIPHYPLGSTNTASSKKNEGEAAKYQAFTIGTIRFVITDLRSESIRSSEYYSGKVYSKEQKQWLFDEFSNAGKYDFVVWVTSRPWTNGEELGSDSWGGFANDRDELADHIASTIGAGPRNLLVLSGDNHMVAFDDGSNTDYSRREDDDTTLGGFPLLHSGPLTNYGGLKDFFKPETNHFTEGCKAYSGELNHQFSTVDFYFQEDQAACIRIKSYSEDTSNVIFEKEMCGEIMKSGTPEQDTCTLEKMSTPNMYLYIAAASLIVLNGISVILFLGLNGCQAAFSYCGLGVLFSLLTIMAAGLGALCFGTHGVNMFSVAALIATQSVAGSMFVAKAIYNSCKSDDEEPKKKKKNSSAMGDVEDGVVKSLEKHNMNAMEADDGASTQDDASDYPPPAFLAMDTTNESTAISAKSRKINSEGNPDNKKVKSATGFDEVTAKSGRIENKEGNSAARTKGDVTVDAILEDLDVEDGAASVLSFSRSVSLSTVPENIAAMFNRRANSNSYSREGSTRSSSARDNDVESPATVTSLGSSVVEIRHSPSHREFEVEPVADAAVLENNIAAMFNRRENSWSTRGSRSARRGDVESPATVASSRHSRSSLREFEMASSVDSEHPFLLDVQYEEKALPKEEKDEGIEVTNPINGGSNVEANIVPDLVEF